MSGSLLPNITYAGIDNRIYALRSEVTSNVGTSSFQQVYTSSIVASTLILDGNVLTTSGNELFFNGKPIADVVSTTSSIAGWSQYDAISPVNLNGYDIQNANIVEAGQYLGILGNYQELFTSSLVASTITVNELIALSTIQTYNYLSTQIVRTDVVSSGQVFADAVVAGTYNGYTVSDFLSSSAIPSTIEVSSLVIDLGKTSTAVLKGDATTAPTVPPFLNINTPYSVNINMGTQNNDIDFTTEGLLGVYGGMYLANPANPTFGTQFRVNGTTNTLSLTSGKSISLQPTNNGQVSIETVNGATNQKGLLFSNVEVSPASNYSQSLWLDGGTVLRTNGGFSVGNNLLAGSNVEVSTINGYTVSDFLSTSQSQYDPNPAFSTLVINVMGYISTPDLEVSSINGHEINQNTVVISTVQTDKLVAVEISSLVGDISLQLVSTLSFKGSLGSNSFSLGGIDLGLADIFGQITGGALGSMSLVTSGVALATGVSALYNTRATNNINTANYELVNGTTQLQVSSILDYVSTIYRFSSGNPADQQVGSEYFVSTISPPGVFIRSMSDPLNTVSTPQSTLQAFGQWVPLPIENIANWAFYPALSNVEMNGFDIVNTDNIQSLNADFSTINFAPSTTLVASQAYSELRVIDRATQSTGQICVNNVKIAPTIDYPNPAFYDYNYTTNRATIVKISPVEVQPIAYLSDLSNISTPSAFSANTISSGIINTGRITSLSSIATTAVANTYRASTFTTAFGGYSTILFASTPIGLAGNTSNTLYLDANSDFSVFNNNIFGGQLRLGYNTPSGAIGLNRRAEVILYSQIKTEYNLNVQNNDIAMRYATTYSTLTTANEGYVLDSSINFPRFSTINNQVNLMAFFPSTINNTFGISTLSVMNPVQQYGRGTLTGGTQTIVLSRPYADSNEYSVQLTYQNSAGGSPLHANILSVSSFSANGSVGNSFFWTTIGRV